MTLDLSFPRRPVVEWYAGGAWRNITSDVRQGKITVSRGRKDEGAKPAPGKCTFVLDDGPEHGNGNYNPRNPMGQWYGELGRNTPVRVSLEAGTDDFDRTVVDGWGTSPANGTWSTHGTGGSTSSVSSGEGLHSIPDPLVFRMSYLAGVQVQDVDVSVDVTVDSMGNVTGGDIEPANIVLRGQSISSYYLVRMIITPAEEVKLQLMLDGSTVLAGPVTYPVGNTGQTWRVRAVMEQGILVGKVWPASDPEPLDWLVGVIRETPLGPGFVGIRTGVGSGNTNTKPIVARYTNFEIRLPRFVGETSALRPSSDLTHTDRTVSVECGGLLRRVTRYRKPLESPIRRFIDRAEDITPMEYWPLEEPATATALGANALPGGDPAVFTRDTLGPGPVGAVKWGVASGIPSVAAVAELTNGAMLTFPVRPHPGLAAGWSVAWGQRLSADSGGRVWLRTTNPENDVYLIFYTDGSYEVYRVDDGLNSELLLTDSFPAAGFDDVWHTFGFSCHDIGSAQAGYSMVVDGGESTGTASALGTFSRLLRTEVTVDPDTTAPGAWSHVAVFPEDVDGLPDDFSGYYHQFFGQCGDVVFDDGQETAANRFIRLCTEEGITPAYTGAPDVSPLMGPQRPLPVVDLLQECVDVDQGTLYEPRAYMSLAIRTLRSVVEQGTAVELDYSNREVAPEFAPAEDDQNTVNDVTAKRTDGGQDRYEQTTGRLNVADPGTASGAAGRYDASVTVNVETEDQLLGQASWRVHMGTVDEARYPTVAVDLAATNVVSQPDLVTRLMDLNIDDFLTVTDVEDALVFEPIRQVVRGYTEVFDTAYQHTVTFNTTPASPYDSASLDDAELRLDSDTSSLLGSATSTATSIDVQTNTVLGGSISSETAWVTTATHPAEFPFDIVVGGERMTVTAITTATSPQVFTVTRSVNGVVKAHPVGAQVSLAHPVFLVP